MSYGELSPADYAAINGNNSRNNGGFGDGSGAWWIIVFVLFFAFGGWGNGFGNRGGNGNGNGGCDVNILPVNGGFGGGYNACCTPATQQQMTDAFNFSKLDSATTGIAQGICDSTYAVTNAINGVNSNLADCCCKNQTTMLQGFNGVDRSLCSGFNSVNTGISNLGFQMQQCLTKFFKTMKNLFTDEVIAIGTCA